MKSRIMIVDDNFSDAQTMAFVLSHYGHAIAVYEDSAEALKHVYEFDPELIICDYHMPHMDGGDFIAHIRKNGRIYPIIFVTADDTKEIILKVFRLGASDIIKKGASPQDFEEVVNRVLEMESLRAQMYAATDADTKKKLGRLIGLHQTIKAKKLA